MLQSQGLMLLTLSGEVYSLNQVAESLVLLLSERDHKLTCSDQDSGQVFAMSCSPPDPAVSFGGPR